MKFGIMNLFPGGDQSSRDVIRDTVGEIELADRLGYDSAWLAEHHFSPYGVLGNPLLMGMALAQRTQRILIGTAVVVVPFHNPLRLAEDASLLDIMSGGRLRLGLGRGYQPREFEGFEVNAADSIDLYNETVDILKLAWSGEAFDYHGKHHRYRGMQVFPQPLTPGGPPIVHGTSSPDNFRRRGLLGEPVICSPQFTPMARMKHNFEEYEKALHEAGHDPARFERPFMQQVWVGERANGHRDAAEAALRYYRMVGKVIPGSDAALAGEREYYEKVQRNIGLLTLERTMTHGGNFGSTQQVIDFVGRLRDDLGVTHYICWFRIPTLERRAALDAMEHFASEVMPLFRSEEAVTSVASGDGAAPRMAARS